MPMYDDWDSLVEAADKKVTRILKQDVAPVVEEIVKSHIQSDIYYAYSPQPGAWINGTTYQRRHILENGVYSTVENDTLFTTSNATASPSIIKGYSFRNRYPGAFLKLLEIGNMGIWRKGFPRPAVSNAQIEIDDNLQSGSISRAIENGIKREFN
ncbi:MAG: hypothetical protein ACI4TK_01275 [Agathobacter sp.]